MAKELCERLIGAWKLISCVESQLKTEGDVRRLSTAAAIRRRKGDELVPHLEACRAQHLMDSEMEQARQIRRKVKL